MLAGKRVDRRTASVPLQPDRSLRFLRYSLIAERQKGHVVLPLPQSPVQESRRMPADLHSRGSISTRRYSVPLGSRSFG